MTTQELAEVSKIFPTAQLHEVAKCTRCQWKGIFTDLKVVPPDFTTFICPQCIEPVADVPHCFFCGRPCDPT